MPITICGISNRLRLSSVNQDDIQQLHKETIVLYQNLDLESSLNFQGQYILRRLDVYPIKKNTAHRRIEFNITKECIDKCYKESRNSEKH